MWLGGKRLACLVWSECVRVFGFDEWADKEGLALADNDVLVNELTLKLGHQDSIFSKSNAAAIADRSAVIDEPQESPVT